MAWWLVPGSWAVTKGQDARRRSELQCLVCKYAELFVRRKTSTNYHHTTLADPPLSLDTPDW